MHGCGWDSGAARERSSALWLPASPRVTRLAPMAWARGRCAPGRPWQPGHCLALRARRRRRGRCATGRLHVLPAYCARCLLGGVGMSKTSCAARCSRGSVQGVLRAPAEGEGGVAHRENFSAAASATLERSAGTVAHGKRAARERRRRRSKVSGRRRAGHAPPARTSALSPIQGGGGYHK